MTRLEVAKALRKPGHENYIMYECKGERLVEVMIKWETFPKQISCRLWGMSHVGWLKLDYIQLLKFIRRHYSRTASTI
jgi:hypothetical protein